MPAPLQSLVGRLTAAVRQFSLAQRTFAVLAVAALVLGGVALSGYLTKPTMGPLFSGLSGADASAIADQLGSKGVKYQLADGGSTILVPQDKLYAERIAMAAAGLPANKDGAGYSLLDSLPVTASEFQQKTTYQRALEGELAKTVGAIDGVERATVQLAIPDDSVFVEKKKDPTASVFVRTRAGTTLSNDQVQAIVRLVSAGIQGMTPNDVAVIDASGKVLSAVGTGPTGGPLSSGATTDYEARVQQAVQRILDPLVGTGNSAVTVTAQLGTSSSQTTTETFSATPTTPPLASSTKTEQYTGTGGVGAAGVLGPDNVAVPSGSTTGTGTYSSTSTDVTNSVNKSTQVVTTPPGGVQRQSVSVAVDAKAGGGLDLTALTQAISAAAGIDPSRGDTISVQRMAFDTTSAQNAATALAKADAATAAEKKQSMIKQAAIAGAVLLLVIFLVVLGMRRSRRARREALDLGSLTAVDEGFDLPDGIDGAGLHPVLPPGPSPLLPDPRAVRREEVEAMADEQPAEVAELLRGWLAAPSSGRRR